MNAYTSLKAAIKPTDTTEGDEDVDQDYEEEDREDLSYRAGSDRVISESESTEPPNTNPPFRRSLFPNVPPFIVFQYNSGSHSLPAGVTKHLKWNWTSITPLIIRKAVTNSGFRLIKECQNWTGTWGKYMKSESFKNLKEGQKFNHYPGTFQVGRKDRLWKNLSRQMVKHGRKEFDFAPHTYVLPQDLRAFRQTWEKSGGKEKWIIKPPAAARGTGIRVVHRWSQIPKKRPLIVQQYLSKPFLINGAKFDLRLYILVTSINPLRVFIYPDGLVRFASVKYNDDINYLSDRLMHLTNYSINKTSASYTRNDCAESCKGHKWTLKSLWAYLEKDGVNTRKIWTSIKDIVVKTLISVESPINSLLKASVSSRYTCYELFGFDIILDEKLKPWLLEVNISPALASASPVDIAVKGPMISNVFNLVGYRLPTTLSQRAVSNLTKLYEFDAVCQDSRLDRVTLSPQERQKHALYVNLDREDYLDDILDDLTPDDVRQLISCEDELTQADKFERIFPTKNSYRYLDFFDVSRYYNMLLDAWENRYAGDRENGIDLLRKLCAEKFHLELHTA